MARSFSKPERAGEAPMALVAMGAAELGGSALEDVALWDATGDCVRSPWDCPPHLEPSLSCSGTLPQPLINFGTSHVDAQVPVAAYGMFPRATVKPLPVKSCHRSFRKRIPGASHGLNCVLKL